MYVEKVMNQSFMNFYIALTIAVRARLLRKISIKTNALTCVDSHVSWTRPAKFLLFLVRLLG